MPKLIKKQTRRRMLQSLAFMVLLGAAALSGWPVDTLEIADTREGAILHSSPVPLGCELETRIIHSVQLTPVVDFYRFQQGGLWGWREAIRSHNAGLPSQAPETGQFYQHGDWMILEGSAKPLPVIYYRVGTEKLGRNEITLPQKPDLPVELWRNHPGKRLSLKAVKKPLASAIAEAQGF
ncbi:DUF1850 domain-containing protein [Desulfovibrio sp. OttesenSCG-928-C06]|nr:DUF1850 domain-containing protein [Desulfovibrio sp. OttesenSCG-928-C06]